MRNDKVKMRRKIYMIWWHIKDRCYNPDNPRYATYGARGVRLCDEWQDFNVFYKDVKFIEGYSDDCIMNGDIHFDKDSKDMDNKLYCKDKCTFISKSMNNKFKPNQMNVFIATSPTGEEYESFNQSEFARTHNLRQSTISDCLKGRVKKHRGWSFSFIE